ncbi:MAG: Ldh family oxidoreductase [Chloroflexi bacterium]|nr:Ldh family oxidoreductase [Chloroflexota bacterium]
MSDGAAGDARTVTISADALRRLCARMLEKAGVPPADAMVVTDSLVDADLRGTHSHGVIQLPGYLQRLAAGGTNPAPALKVVCETPAMAIVDGDGGMGQVVSHFAMQVAIRKGKETGVGVAAVRNSEHFGACAYWSLMAVAQDMIGICSTNGVSCMPPYGGITGTIGNNPIAIAAPAGREYPLVIDVATSVVAQGKMRVAAAKGEKIPLDWAITLDGDPTDDPVEGLKGLVLPFGGYKGFGLALAFEVLTAILPGALFAKQIPLDPGPNEPARIGHFFQAIDIAPVMGVPEFKQRVDELVRQVKESRLAKGFSRIYALGEIEEAAKAQRLKTGIPLASAAVEDLKSSAAGLGVMWAGL